MDIDERLEWEAREIARKFGCTDWQGLAIAVQIEQNRTLEEISERIYNHV
jgi:hypothetical protein